MAGFFKNIKRSFGKDNPAYQSSLKYYNLYHHLPYTLQGTGKLFSGGMILIMLFISGIIALFVYAIIQGLTDIPEKKTSDYTIGMIMLPCFVVMLIAAGFFLVRFKIRKRKKWKSFENAFVKGEGAIIGKWWESTPQVDNIGGMDYFIAVQYDGSRRIKAPVSSGEFYKFKVNDKVKLRFVSFQPEVCELIKHRPKPQKFSVLIFVLGILCLSVYFILKQKPDKALLMTLKGHTCAVTSVAISPDNKYIASGGGRFAGDKGQPFGEALLWELQTGKLVRKLDTGNKMVTGLKFGNTNNTLITVANYNDYRNKICSSVIKRWDYQLGKPLDSIEIANGYVNCFDLTPEGALVISATVNDTDRLRLYRPRVWDSFTNFDSHIYPCYNMSVSRDGSHLALAAGKIQIWDLINRTPSDTVEFIDKEIHSSGISFSSDNKYLLFCGSGVLKFTTDDAFTRTTDIDFYKPTSGIMVIDLLDHKNSYPAVVKNDAAHCCCFVGNKGDYLIGGNSTIYLKSLKGENIHIFRGHLNPVKALAVTSDGKTMVSASLDGTVKVWDIGY